MEYLYKEVSLKEYVVNLFKELKTSSPNYSNISISQMDMTELNIETPSIVYKEDIPSKERYLFKRLKETTHYFTIHIATKTKDDGDKLYRDLEYIFELHGHMLETRYSGTPLDTNTTALLICTCTLKYDYLNNIIR